MKSAPILSVREATISFAKKILFENLHFNIFPRDRVCLIGKNGVGKTTLMNVIAGEFDLDCGDRFLTPGAVCGYLTQSEKLPKKIIKRDCDHNEPNSMLKLIDAVGSLTFNLKIGDIFNLRK
jgi:ATPase subunit of ABC transporter with duplicated ATPase domains